ncbi:hypothetical protein HTZ97_08390 [Desulfuromonas acetoxidans]|uniref:Polysulphide reductase, NrfD n=1 Tax=Desulfuromonas acetoxidans (strain DSM 684 / 11070) TaxID=281689 RepID=Q1K0H3_DESA6|nr:hypothetical protein [Desulfuromonas acetoxidans]EAT15968.1 conserved hypothetical protein [Desulfuromonas acetoxidans DSM 684]MBF0644134.1 hypothetical protein [Desulfuromonas acetoxidans]NVD24568.1 hypothetical protein [Desulfuromonas acetoxidans]NVE16482.1 hypothetical protein [Desulfuromonas acetoxidans]
MMSLVPTPDALPMASGYFELLLLLTFPLHLVFMNAMLGGTMLAIWAHFKREPVHERLAYKIAQVLPLLIAFAINFGVPPLLFVQVVYGHLIYSSSVLMGVFWLSVIPVLLTVYYAVYIYDFKFWSLGRRGLPILMFAGVLMLMIAFLFSNNMTLMLTPETWDIYFKNSSGTFLNLAEPTLWPRYLHMLVGATAIGALVIALLGRLWAKQDAEVGELAQRVGLRVFLAVTCVQIMVGLWFLVALPADVMMMFMGRNLFATAVFLVAIATVMGVIFLAVKRRLVLCGGLALLLLYLMSLMRAFVRTGYVDNLFVTQIVEAQRDFSPLLLFVVTLVIGLLLIFWMIKVSLQAQEN